MENGWQDEQGKPRSPTSFDISPASACKALFLEGAAPSSPEILPCHDGGLHHVYYRDMPVAPDVAD
ncbi:MAG: hypothetical protein BGN83_03670 [Rhizobium sp. 63-7]|nr:MAG: hypothetical protein BGN83_03670 [Rhizobium sp. 63-7]